MYELMRVDSGVFETVYVFEKLEDAFKEAYFFDEEILWGYNHEDNQIFFWEGWLGNDMAFLIKPSGVTTPPEEPPEDPSMI